MIQMTAVQGAWTTACLGLAVAVLLIDVRVILWEERISNDWKGGEEGKEGRKERRGGRKGGEERKEVRKERR